MTEDPFRYIYALVNHEHLIVEDDYVPFLTCRYFSYFLDTMFLANVASGFSAEMDKQLHFDFLYALVTKKYRRAIWHKPKDGRDWFAICKYYNCSEKEARMYAPVICDELYKEILEQVDVVR